MEALIVTDLHVPDDCDASGRFSAWLEAREATLIERNSAATQSAVPRKPYMYLSSSFLKPDFSFEKIRKERMRTVHSQSLQLPSNLKGFEALGLEGFAYFVYDNAKHKLLSIATKMVFPGERKPFPFHFAVRVSRADSQLTWTYTCR